jgi:hypothetical protein
VLNAVAKISDEEKASIVAKAMDSAMSAIARILILAESIAPHFLHSLKMGVGYYKFRQLSDMT